jgi:hypothetical protein
MDEQPDANLMHVTSVTDMIELAYSVRGLGSDIVGAANALETLLSTDDLRAARGAAELLSDWSLKLSERVEHLRDSIVTHAREDAQRFLDETTS